MSETQKVGNESIAIQAGGNVSIGLGYRDIKDICNDLFNNNFPQLVAEASKIASENLLKYIACLESKLNDIEKTKISESLKTPNGQYILNESIQNAARFGSKIDISLLCETTKQALLNEDNSLSQSFYLASQIIPQLNKEQLLMVLASFYISFLSVTTPDPRGIEAYAAVLFSDFTEFPKLHYGTKYNMVSLGVYSFNQFTGGDAYTIFKGKYTDEYLEKVIQLYESGEMPTVKKIIDFYNSNELIQFPLCPVAHAIGYILAKNKVGEIPITLLTNNL